jgi:glutamate carboxypeptidase
VGRRLNLSIFFMNPESLDAFCRARLPDTLEFLRQMVAINSFTENANGVNRVGELVAEVFAPLGFQPIFVQASDARYGRHLVLRREPIPGAPTVALISHLDTVFTPEEEQRNGFAWRPEGTRIYGPGTNDIKGGTAMIHLVLSALRAQAPTVDSRTNWVVLLNACEEVISADFRQVCLDHLPADPLAGLLFEADGGEGDGFSLVAARKGRATFQIEVEGRGAHAGGQHRRGVNAVVQLAEVVTALHDLTDYDAGLTVNIGSMQGGTVTNRVPHFASADLEMRAFALGVYERAKQRILAWHEAGTLHSQDGEAHRCRVAVHLRDETVPWPCNAGTDSLLALWQRTAQELGLRVEAEQRGGLSDGNVLWDCFPVLDGLGPRGDNCHCSEQSADGSKQQEWVDVTSFVPKAMLNVCALERLVAAEK